MPKKFLFRLHLALLLLFFVKDSLFATLNSSLKVDTLPSGNRMSVQLLVFYSADENSPSMIHLLEHFVAKGNPEETDFLLESSGLSLSASTQDHLVQFAIDGNPNALEKALSAFKQVLTPLNITSKDLVKEISILKEEKEYSKFHDPELLHSTTLFDGFDELEKLTPLDLEAIRKKVFQPENLILSVSGPFDKAYVEKITRQIFPVFFQKKYLSPALPIGKKIKISHDNQTYSVPMAGLEDERSLARLIAGFIISFYDPGLQLIYTPSVLPTYLRIGSKNNFFINQQRVESARNQNRLRGTGIELACRWVESFLNTPHQRAYFMGILAKGNMELTPEKLILKLKNISEQEIEEAFKWFQLSSPKKDD